MQSLRRSPFHQVSSYPSPIILPSPYYRGSTEDKSPYRVAFSIIKIRLYGFTYSDDHAVDHFTKHNF